MSCLTGWLPLKTGALGFFFFFFVYSSTLDCCIRIFSYYVMLVGESLRNVEKWENDP